MKIVLLSPQGVFERVITVADPGTHYVVCLLGLGGKRAAIYDYRHHHRGFIIAYRRKRVMPWRTR